MMMVQLAALLRVPLAKALVMVLVAASAVVASALAYHNFWAVELPVMLVLAPEQPEPATHCWARKINENQ